MCSAREPAKSLKNNWLPYPRLVRSGRPTAERHVTDGSLLVPLSSHRQSPSVTVSFLQEEQDGNISQTATSSACYVASAVRTRSDSTTSEIDRVIHGSRLRGFALVILA